MPQRPQAANHGVHNNTFMYNCSNNGTRTCSQFGKGFVLLCRPSNWYGGQGVALALQNANVKNANVQDKQLIQRRQRQSPIRSFPIPPLLPSPSPIQPFHRTV